MATLGLLKIKVFWKNGNDVMTSVYDATRKLLWRDDSNDIVEVVKWPKFDNSGISIREVIIALFNLKNSIKKQLFEG